MINFKSKHRNFSNKDEGFITLEIIVGILIATAFLAVSLQSLVYAMAIKIQAQEKQRANQLISEDLETANELANRSNLLGDCDPADYDNGYGKGLWNALNTGGIPTKNLSDNGARQVSLERTEVSNNANSTDPHRTLRIKYQVWWGVNGTNFLDKAGNTKNAADKPIVETYVEIIPDVALACP